MKLSKVNGILVEITTPTGETFNVATHDLLSSLIATVGWQDWLKDLTQAHMKLADGLHDQNYGDVGTEPYDRSDRQAGLAMEKLCGDIANKLMDLRAEYEDGEVY